MNSSGIHEEYQKYLAAIGRVAVGAASIEEVVIFGILSLTSNADEEQLHLKHLRKGFKKNIDELQKIARQNLQNPLQKKILDILDETQRLREERNEKIHGQWFIWADAETNKPKGIGFSRYFKDEKTGRLEWQPHIVPTLDQLNKLGFALEDCMQRLSTALKDVLG